MERGKMEQDELTYIKIPYPGLEDLALKIIVPTSTLIISPGIGNAWVTGRFNDPKQVVPLSITQSENVAQIVAVGAFAYRTPRKYLPEMKLSFGRASPFSLSISSGDMSNRLDLGGLPLTSLDIQFGIGPQVIDFSYPNPQGMDRMKIRADKGPVQITNLGNANAAEIRLNGDSTIYQVNFGGELRQNLDLFFGSSVARAEVFALPVTAIKVFTGSSPDGHFPDDFSYADNAYWNTAARENKEPVLGIHHSASYGPLKLKYI